MWEDEDEYMHYLHGGKRMSEDEWWDRHCEDEAEAEAEAMAAAERSADLYEFDSDEERDAYIREAYEDRLAELLEDTK